MSRDRYQICAHLHADPSQASAVIPDEHGTATHWCQWCAATRITALIESHSPSQIAPLVDYSQCPHCPEGSRLCRLCQLAVHSTLSAHFAHLKILGETNAATRLNNTLSATTRLHGRPLLVGRVPDSSAQIGEQIAR